MHTPRRGHMQEKGSPKQNSVVWTVVDVCFSGLTTVWKDGVGWAFEAFVPSSLCVGNMHRVRSMRSTWF